jgi:hypothetical protein
MGPAKKSSTVQFPFGEFKVQGSRLKVKKLELALNLELRTLNLELNTPSTLPKPLGSHEVGLKIH